MEIRGFEAEDLDACYGAWLDIAAGRGARAFHIGVNRENTGAIDFWRTRAFEALSLDSLPEGRTLWMGRNLQFPIGRFMVIAPLF